MLKLAVKVEREYDEFVNRLVGITDKLEPRKNKITPVTDQSTQGA